MEEVEIDEELVEELRKSKQKFGALAPIILDKHGNVVEGHHRLMADPQWPKITYDEIQTEEDRVLFAIAFNWHRREKSAYWKTKMLSWLAKKGYNVEQIAEKTGLSKRTVYMYLPAEFKGPEPEELARARLAREERKFVPCAVCGVAVSEPVHVGGKFYCDKHAPTQQAATVEARTAIQPEAPTLPSKSIPSVNIESSEPIPQKVSEPKPEPLLTGFEVECPECHRKLLINHIQYPDGKSEHKVELQ